MKYAGQKSALNFTTLFWL